MVKLWAPWPLRRVSLEDKTFGQKYDQDWIGLCSVLRPRQHSIGYMGDGFYRSNDPTNNKYQSTEGDATKEKANNENN